MRNGRKKDNFASLSPFTYSVLPFSEIPDDPRPPSPETEEMALHDVCVQFITLFTAAAKDRSDPLGPIRILAHCVHILDDYAGEGFTQLAEFRNELQSDLHNALRKARRFFLREFFLCSEAAHPRFLQTLRDTGWTTKGESGQDYQMVVEELFDGDDFRPAAKAERARRSHA
jgi:hypothetical protein